MLRPAIDETSPRRPARCAPPGCKPSDLRAVVLVGGSSRIPLVAQLVTSARSGDLSPIDTDPKHAIALGAARHAHLTADRTRRPHVAEPTDRRWSAAGAARRLGRDDADGRAATSPRSDDAAARAAAHRVHRAPADERTDPDAPPLVDRPRPPASTPPPTTTPPPYVPPPSEPTTPGRLPRPPVRPRASAPACSSSPP